MPTQPLAATYKGYVQACHDADTCRIRFAGQVQRVRFGEIDAPEIGQPFGDTAGRALSDMIVGRTVTIVTDETDRYGRPVATIYLSGRSVNAELVRKGYAWVNPRYSHDPQLALLQVRARMTRSGLWALPDPTPPWEWRRRH
jgi:endonuclease YncB( thermonuclease family)